MTTINCKDTYSVIAEVYEEDYSGEAPGMWWFRGFQQDSFIADSPEEAKALALAEWEPYKPEGYAIDIVSCDLAWFGPCPVPPDELPF